MDEEIKEICKKSCIEYCENGFVSESVYEDFMVKHSKLSYSDRKQVDSFMRGFIEQYIRDHNLPWRNNRMLYGVVHEVNIFTDIDELPKEGYIGPFHFEIIESEE